MATNCGPIQFVDGGVLKDTTLLDPSITGGTLNNSTIVNGTFTDGLSMDERTLRELARILGPYLEGQITVSAEEVAQVFRSCHGLPLIPDMQIPTCQEMEEAIRLAVCEGCGGGEGGDGDTITNFTWVNNQTTLRIVVLKPNGSTVNWDVDMSMYAKITISADLPEKSTQTELPTTLYGGRDILMGRPDAFGAVTIAGSQWLVPLYRPEP